MSIPSEDSNQRIQKRNIIGKHDSPVGKYNAHCTSQYRMKMPENRLCEVVNRKGYVNEKRRAIFVLLIRLSNEKLNVESPFPILENLKPIN
jgi:hypothetical protein